MKRIIINTAISFYHKKKAKKELALIDEKVRRYDIADQQEGVSKKMELDKSDIDEGNFGFDIVAGADFTYEELFNMLEELSKPFRDVFNLHCIEGYKHKEIAEMLNLSPGTIEFHRNNLRKKLGLRNTKTNLRSYLMSIK